jgi:hypothetical protein
MLTSAVFLEPPIHGAGMFTTVTFPEPDGNQTSDVGSGAGMTVGSGVGVTAGVAASVAAGVAAAVGSADGVEVGDDGLTAARTAAGPGPAESHGRPVALTTPVAIRSETITPSPEKAARRLRLVLDLRWAIDRDRLCRTAMSGYLASSWDVDCRYRRSG